MQIDWNEVVYYKDGTLYRRSTDGPLTASCSNGHLSFRHKGKNYLVARVMWELLKGPIPEGMCVSHIDKTLPLSTRIENLRLQTRSQLNAKRKTVLGAAKGAHLNKYGKYQVQVMSNGVNKHIGMYDNLPEAVAAATKVRTQLYGD